MKSQIKMVRLLLAFFFYLLFTVPAGTLLIGNSFARTTPEDILNEKRGVYQERVKNYSSANKQKLENFSQKISDLNKKITDSLNQNMESQGQVLEEYIRRQGIKEKKVTDGVNRDLSDDIENARYWLTYTHEAVAFQKAKVYIFSLTGEANIKNDILSQISELEYDLSSLKQKVIKSQKIIRELIR